DYYCLIFHNNSWVF
nr:immunoglobulin light chain junction region [Macaca mulatta]